MSATLLNPELDRLALIGLISNAVVAIDRASRGAFVTERDLDSLVQLREAVSPNEFSLAPPSSALQPLGLQFDRAHVVILHRLIDGRPPLTTFEDKRALLEYLLTLSERLAEIE